MVESAPRGVSMGLSDDAMAYEAVNYLRLLRRYWFALFIACFAGQTAAYAYHTFAPKTYTANAPMVVVVTPTDRQNMQEALAADTLAQGAAKTAVSLGRSPLVAQDVAHELGEPSTAEALLRRVSVESNAGSRLIDLSVSAASPADAEKLADAWVAATQRVFRATNGASSLRLERVSGTQTSDTPEAKPLVLELAVGVMLGIVFWLIYAVIRDRRPPSELGNRSRRGREG